MSPVLTVVSLIVAFALFAIFEFPEQLRPPKSWFRVLWGYPTFLNYEYDTIYTQPVQFIEQISHLLPERQPPEAFVVFANHTPRCDFALSSSGNCFYKVTAQRCSPNNRLPLLWEDAVVQCYDENEREVDCLLSDMKVDNDLCQNVPEKVVYEQQKTSIYFKSVALNTWHQEKSEFFPEQHNCTFSQNEKLVANGFFGLWRPDNGCRCSGDKFKAITYGVDVFSTCYNKTEVPATEEECNELAEISIDFLLSQVNVSHLCKCSQCNIPVVVQRPKITTFWIADNETSVCALPSNILISIFSNDSSVVEVQTSFQRENFTCSDNSTCFLPLESRVQFKKFQEDSKIASFYLQRGRFHCPSEVTCWKELFYFAKLINFYAPFAEFMALTPLLGLTVIYLFRSHYTQSFVNLLGLKQ